MNKLSCHCSSYAAHTTENNHFKRKMQLDMLTYSSYVEMEITRKFDEPDITLGNRVFLKDVNYTLDIHTKK